jgi:predicted amidohydrolase
MSTVDRIDARSVPAPSLDLTVVQGDFRPLRLEENRARMEAAVAETPPGSLVVFPELSLTGYTLHGRGPEVAVASMPAEGAAMGYQGTPMDAPMAVPDGERSALVGLVESSPDGRLYNASALVDPRGASVAHRKCYLPTYGAFDEGRIFAPSREPPRVLTLPGGWKMGVLICEDLWHPSLMWLLAMQGADAVVVQAAPPGRGGPGVREGFASMDRWHLMIRTAAVQYGVYVALANRVGVEEGFTFGGGSCLVGPDGTELWMAGPGETVRHGATLHRESLLEARRPYSHLRDENPALLRRGIDDLAPPADE